MIIKRTVTVRVTQPSSEPTIHVYTPKVTQNVTHVTNNVEVKEESTTKKVLAGLGVAVGIAGLLL